MLLQFIEDSLTGIDKSIPSILDIPHTLAKETGLKMDKKQLIAYEIICSTFLLGLLVKAHNESTKLQKFSSTSGHTENRHHKLYDNVYRKNVAQALRLELSLRRMGGKEQLLMFLTGPSGAGKATTVKAAQRFCTEFCEAINIPWYDNRISLTACTKTKAVCLGGDTIWKAAQLRRINHDKSDIMYWQGVQILVIDEISFMRSQDMKLLDEKLRTIKDKTRPFGGLSILFSGDFRQLEPPGAKCHELLFSKQASTQWENKLNTIVILENMHQFKEDVTYGRLLRRMWKHGLTSQDRHWLNRRVIGGRTGLVLPKANYLKEKDAFYISYSSKDRSSVSAKIVKDYIVSTHPSIHDSELSPPEDTIIVESDIRYASPKAKHISSSMREFLKQMEPTLCLYIGARLICTNGISAQVKLNTPECRFVGIKLKDGQTTYIWKNYYNKKVWTVNASDVEWVECECFPKADALKTLEKKIHIEKTRLQQYQPNQQNQENLAQVLNLESKIQMLEQALEKESSKHKFRVHPRQVTNKITYGIQPTSERSNTPYCNITQLPLMTNNVGSGYRLHGQSRDVVVIASWPTTDFPRNWEYVVLSSVTTINGLYLLKPISLEKSFNPSDELKSFFGRIEAKESRFLSKHNHFTTNL